MPRAHMMEGSSGKQIASAHAIGLVTFHLVALAAVIATQPLWGDLLIAAMAYLVQIFGITAGYHRLFTHQSYTASPGFSLFIALAGNAAGEGPVKRWVANHWLHHRWTETEKDPHSPVAQGFWHAHMGWLLDASKFDQAIAEARRFRFRKSVEWVDRHSNSLFFSQILILGLLHWIGHLISPFSFSGPPTGLLWSFFVAVPLGLHATFAVNSVCHLWGYENVKTENQSRNHPIVALLTLGEGWHSNHHLFPHSARHGLKIWEVDLTYFLLRSAETLGWVSDLKKADLELPRT